ncbi:P-loop containing nucleoside triphosphate hydrolase protein [Hymenopellis radicata]|nr:P-loop containing nucleoside triphosphate hydrolase protein [Hymenopellis radicata]
MAPSSPKKAPSSPRKAPAEPQTPTRRSKRGQPVVDIKAASTSANLAWSTRNLPRKRLIDPVTDLDNDGADSWNKLDQTERKKLRTYIYDAFERTKTTTVKKKAPGQKRAAETKIETTDTYCIGDTVLVQSASAHPSVAVIVGLWETDLNGDDDEPLSKRMHIRIQWFLRPKQLPKVGAKREHQENEIYYSTTKNMILESPDAILGHCRVRDGHEEVDDDPFVESNGFQCRSAVDSQRGLFYNFEWKAHRQDALAKMRNDYALDISGAPWQSWHPRRRTNDFKESQDSPFSLFNCSQKSRLWSDKEGKEEEDDSSGEDHASGDEFEEPADSDEEEGDADDSDADVKEEDMAQEAEEEIEEPKTPSRKRKRGNHIHIAQKTPENLARLARKTPSSPRKRQKFTRVAQPSYASEALQDLPDDPYLRAMHILHVGSRPDALPCRNTEFQHVMESVQTLLEEGSGGCIYISGVPGTGKTATVHAVIRELMKLAEDNEINPFTYVEINGLRVPEPPAAYNILWEAISQHDIKKDGRLQISSKESLKNLTGYFAKGQGRGPEGHACIVLMDELDQLVTTKQDVVYNFFNWPTIADSKLIVIAVANTHDLPERVMTGRVRSRLGMVRTNFTPYSIAQLTEIVSSRLESVKREGDPEVINRDAIKLAASRVANLTGDARRILDVCRRAVELVRPEKRVASSGDIVQVMSVMQNNPTAAYLRDLSFHERLMLASLVKCVKREGVEEIKWGEVQHQHLTYMDVLRQADDPRRKPNDFELGVVLESLVASRAMLVEDGVAASRKAEEERKVMLNLDQSEVERVLGEVGGDVWKKVLN